MRPSLVHASCVNMRQENPEPMQVDATLKLGKQRIEWFMVDKESADTIVKANKPKKAKSAQETQEEQEAIISESMHGATSAT